MQLASNVRRFVAAGEGEAFWWKGGSQIVFKADAADSLGGYALTEARIEPGSGVNPHMHPHEHELFYMLDGSIDVRVGLKTLKASKGDFIAIPPRMPHEFWNREKVHANFINPFIPPGLQEMFRAGGLPTWRHPEPLPDTEEHTRRAIETAQSFGVVGRTDLLDWDEPGMLRISTAMERQGLPRGMNLLARVSTEVGECACYELKLNAHTGFSSRAVQVRACTIFVIDGEVVCGGQLRLRAGDVATLRDFGATDLRAEGADASCFVLCVE